jgi:hypothetical protein
MGIAMPAITVLARDCSPLNRPSGVNVASLADAAFGALTVEKVWAFFKTVEHLPIRSRPGGGCVNA